MHNYYHAQGKLTLMKPSSSSPTSPANPLVPPPPPPTAGWLHRRSVPGGYVHKAGVDHLASSPIGGNIGRTSAPYMQPVMDKPSALGDMPMPWHLHLHLQSISLNSSTVPDQHVRTPRTPKSHLIQPAASLLASFFAWRRVVTTRRERCTALARCLLLRGKRCKSSLHAPLPMAIRAATLL